MRVEKLGIASQLFSKKNRLDLGGASSPVENNSGE
jgi:hypothetical protein